VLIPTSIDCICLFAAVNFQFKIALVSTAVLLMLFSGQRARGAATIFSDGFENGLNGWQVGDNNPAGPPAYWGIVDSAFGGQGTHGGTNKLYCAANGYTGTAVSPLYVGGMGAFAMRSLDLSAYTNATLSFWHKIPSIENIWDTAKVFIDNTELWSMASTQTGWTQVNLSLDAYVGGIHTLSFQFASDNSANYEGWYLDDILVTDISIPGPPRTNDAFSAAQPLRGANGSATGSNRQATSEPGEPTSGFASTNSVWFSWTTITNGQATFSTEGSSFDTVLCVYSGTNLAGLTLVASDDNSGSNNASRVTFAAVAGVQYRISVRGATNDSGTILLSWSQPNVILVDLLPDMICWADQGQNYLYGWYLDRSVMPGHTLLRLASATPNIGIGPLELIGSSSAPGVYQRIYRNDGSFYDRYAGTFTFHPGHGHLHFDNWLNFNIRSVLPGDGVGAIVVAGDKTSSAIIDLQNYDEGLPGHPSIAQYSGGLVQGLSVGWADVYGADLEDQWIDITGIVPGSYWLEEVVDPANNILELNESNNVARILIDLDQTGLTGAPPNDNFTNATLISGITAGVFGYNSQGTKETGSSEPNHAGNAGGASVWYSWIAPSNMNVTLSTEGSEFDTLLAVYTGSALGGLSLVGSNDNAGFGTASLVTFNATAGTGYRIAVDGFGGASGNFQLNVNPAWNDNFSNAVVLIGPSGVTSGSNRGATREPGEPLHAGASGNQSIWYYWTAPTNGLMAFDTEGSGFDTLLAVYTGSAPGALAGVASDNDSGLTNTSRLTFNALSNTTYRIAVDGVGSANGLVRLRWQGPTPPSVTAQPLGTNLTQGSILQLSVGASGWLPLSYKWRHSGANLTDDGRISGATTATLNIGNVLPGDTGPYTVVITNLYGAVTSAPANLIVLDNPRAIYLEDLNGAVGGAVSIPVEMLAVGDEHAFNFSLLFDPAVLSNPRVILGTNASAAALAVNTNNVASGSIGMSFAFPIGQAVASGVGRELARVLFDVNSNLTNGTTTFVGFGDIPLARYAASTNGATLYPTFAAGQLTLQQVPTVIIGSRQTNGGFQVSLSGVPGRSYVLETTAAIAPAIWQPVATNQTSLAGTLQFIDPAPLSLRSFYRARLLSNY
jgi:hypothetical protein